MEKTITTGTEITFKKTGDKFTLTKTDAGFDVKQIKLSKTTPAENYSFEELLDLYESGLISIEGFEDTEAALVKSILTNYIHTTEIETLKADIIKLTGEKEVLEAANQKLETESLQLKTTNQELTAANEKLTAENSELANNNTELAADNKNLASEITKLKEINEQLNTTITAMDEK